MKEDPLKRQIYKKTTYFLSEGQYTLSVDLSPATPTS